LNLPSRDNTTDIADINAISDNFEIIDGAFLDLVEKEIPKLQTKENMNLDFDDDSTNEEQYPSVPAVVNFTNRKVNPLKIVNSASGNAIAIKDSAKDKLVNLKLYGKTTQDGTPTPTEPKALKSVGDSGSFEVGVYSGNLIPSPHWLSSGGDKGVTWVVNSDNSITFNGTATADMTRGLCQIIGVVGQSYTVSGSATDVILYVNISNDSGSVSWLNSANGHSATSTFPNGYSSISLGWYIAKGTTFNNVTIYPQIELGTQATPYEKGNKQTLTMPYTLRSVGDIKDEIDFNRGVFIQKIAKRVLTENDNWQNFDAFGLNDFYDHAVGEVNLMCDKLPVMHGVQVNAGIKYSIGFNRSRENKEYLYVSLPNDIVPQGDITAFKTWLSENPIEIVYEIEPIETPISESELNAYRQLHTNKPNTTILSEADMEVSYVADTKLYIDNKLAELTALALEV
jgi:hypothetical protein